MNKHQVEALFRHAEQLHMAGRLAEAEPVYRQVVAVSHRHANALHALAALLLQSGQPANADAFVVKALGIKPAVVFQLTRAHILLALGRPADAAQCARLVVRAQPNNAAAQQVLGHALSDLGQAEAALEAYRTATRLQAGLPDIQNNLGMALRQAGRLAEAEVALRLAPPDPEALVNLSIVQKERGDVACAEATLRQALRLSPDNPVLQYNWALLMLLLGRTEAARDGWEQRFRCGAIPARDYQQPEWNGELLAGRKLLVWTEQGLGDVIQFARFLAGIEGNVIFDAPPRLARLLVSNPAMPPMGAGESDLVVPLMSLPFRTISPPASSGSANADPDEAGTNLAAMGATPPYLFAEPNRVAAWRERIGEWGFRVGIAWQGFAGRYEDRGRSLPLTVMRPLACPGVRLISLQKGDGEEQVASAGFPVESLPGLDDGPDAFLDTAAVMMSCDLIVTSDTSIAHLAGALGRPVWTALRFVPDWRWMLGRNDSPWYPSMRLFRQTVDGDWAPVFDAMAEALPR